MVRRQVIQLLLLLCTCYFPCFAGTIAAALPKCDDRQLACRPPFKWIQGSCLLFNGGPVTDWLSSRVYCQERGADLAIIKTGNELTATINYLKEFNSGHSAWIAGSSLKKDWLWEWLDGTPMPRGTPFWGSYKGYYREPGIDQYAESEPCVMMFVGDGYTFHSQVCGGHYSFPAAPLCQYFP